MKTSFSKKIFYSTLLIIALFGTGLIIVQQRIESEMKFDSLADKLEAYNDLLHQAYDAGRIAEVRAYLPEHLRITIIANEGEVLKDTEVTNVGAMEKHDTRPELLEARFKTIGSDIRKSASTGRATLYIATYYGVYYIRTALPYDAPLQKQLVSSNYFIIISLLGFLGIVLLLYFLLRRYDRIIQQLRLAADKLIKGLPVTLADLPKTSDQSLSDQLVAIIRQKQESRKELEEAQERLISHFQLSHTGIALFNAKNEVEYTNSLFIQYANILSVGTMTEASQFLREPLMRPIVHFIEDPDNTERCTAITTTESNRIFSIKALKSGGNKFEITIEDVTQEEQNRRLKQEMTSNITHEIRTPLTSIRGYLETLNFMNLSESQRKDFTEKAFQQSLRLSELMDDISLLSKLDEESRHFDFEEVNMHQLAEEIRINHQDQIEAEGAHFHNEVPEETILQGNRSLLYSIVQNLFENSLRYAGEGVDLVLKLYHQDSKYLYFSYHDTGIGVPSEHLPRLFERFYRVDSGRTRAEGGTGLGLSIVKNAVLLHGGQIQARAHASGGLEIHFTLHR